jgi:hypothetical protein
MRRLALIGVDHIDIGLLSSKLTGALAPCVPKPKAFLIVCDLMQG